MGKKKWTNRENKTDLAEIRTSEPIPTVSAGYVRDSKKEITQTSTTADALTCSIVENVIVTFLSIRKTKPLVEIYGLDLYTTRLKYGVKNCTKIYGKFCSSIIAV